MGQTEDGITRHRYPWDAIELVSLTGTLSPQIRAMGIDSCLPLAHPGLASRSFNPFAAHHSWTGAGLASDWSLFGEYTCEEEPSVTLRLDRWNICCRGAAF